MASGRWSRWVTDAPEWVTPLERKWFVVRNAVNLLAFALHVGFAALFAGLGQWPAAFAAWALAPVHLAVIWTSWAGFVRMSGVVAHVEGNAALVACVLLLGLDAGFQNLLLLPLLTFPPRARLLRVAFTALPVVLFVACEALGTPTGQVETTPWARTVLHAVALTVAFAGVIVPVAYFTRGAVRAEAMLEDERRRSWDLLRAVMPERIAARLLEDPGSLAESHDDVTVLFADLVGFTAFAEEEPAADVVELLDEIFSRFDAVVEHHRIHKVKTIGDAYMAAGGLPGSGGAAARRVCRAALDMHDELASVSALHGFPFQLRIGIHSGPLVAGVIGARNLRYDLWGATVNLASRLQALGEPGTTQISAATRARVGGEFDLRPRGPIQVKGIGPTVTYWLVGVACHVELSPESVARAGV